MSLISSEPRCARCPFVAVPLLFLAILVGTSGCASFMAVSPDPKLVESLETSPWSKKHTADVGILIDYDYPFFIKRLWVIAFKEVEFEGEKFEPGAVIMNTRVSHAHRSGWLFATRFSNVKESRHSSRGYFKTARKLHPSPKHGYPALKVHGLQRGLNEKAKNRSIIFHKSSSLHSIGCFMTSPEVNKRLTKLIRGGAILYVHASDPEDLTEKELCAGIDTCDAYPFCVRDRDRCVPK